MANNPCQNRCYGSYNIVVLRRSLFGIIVTMSLLMMVSCTKDYPQDEESSITVTITTSDDKVLMGAGRHDYYTNRRVVMQELQQERDTVIESDKQDTVKQKRSLYEGYGDNTKGKKKKKKDTTTTTLIPAEVKVFNGTDAEEDRFPYYTAMYDRDGNILCGGTLIASNIVLSAAHCQLVPLSYVVVGQHSTDLNETDADNTTSERIPIAGLYPNPKWIYDEYSFDQMIVKLAFDSTNTPVAVNLDPTVPEPDTNLTLIGFGRFSNAPFSPDTLQETEVLYIENDDCKLVENELGELPYLDRLTDDMICIDGGGITGQCSGDSGGPYLIKGESVEEDIQVGTVSWTAGGACDGQQPGVGARTSVYEWIQVITCQHATDPLSTNFDCSGTDTFSPAPTRAPSPPTASPAPTAPLATVTFSIYFDDHPEEIAWSIVSRENDITYGEIPYFFYPPGTQLTRETLFLHPGDYSLRIKDSYGDGIISQSTDDVAFDVILSDESRGIKFLLLEEDGDFRTIRSTFFTVPTVDEYPSTAPSAVPTTSPPPTQPTIEVFLTINLDEWSKEISWSIADADNPEVVFAEVLPGTYTTGGTVTETVRLPFGVYVLTVEDNFGDGLAGEASEVGFFLWVEEPGTKDQIVLLEGPADFEVEISMNFTLTEESVGFAT